VSIEVIKNLYKKHRFWLVLLILYPTLIYSTGFIFSFGPESRLNLTYLEQDYGVSFSSTSTKMPLKEITNFEKFNFWKLTFPLQDAQAYLAYAENNGEAIAPYKYRFFPIAIAKYTAKFLNTTPTKAFILWNIIFAFSTAMLLTLTLLRDFEFNKPLSVLGGILFITMPGVTQTISIPGLENISFFFILLAFIASITHNLFLFIPIAILGVLSKEILLLASVLWFVNNLPNDNKDAVAWIKLIAICSIAPLTFSLSRLALGGSAIEVNFGFNLLAGEFPEYYKRILNPRVAISNIITMFTAFMFLWFGLFNLKKNIILWRSSLIIPLTILVTWLFSGILSRTLAILFPVIIPSFLYFFKNYSLEKDTNIPLINKIDN